MAPALLAATMSLNAAGLSLSGTVTPLAGSFLYELDIANAGPDDYSLVSITDAPLGDPLIDPSLTTPAGFLGSYDSGLGIIDFLEAAQSFAAGTVFGGFSFESLTGPAAAFASFEALTTQGAPASGDISWEVRAVPEPSGGMLSLLAVAFGFAALSRTISRSREVRRR
jgi:hypothetical protein